MLNEFDVTNTQCWQQLAEHLNSFDVVIFQFPLIPAFIGRDAFDKNTLKSEGYTHTQLLRSLLIEACLLAVTDSQFTPEIIGIHASDPYQLCCKDDNAISLRHYLKQEHRPSETINHLIVRQIALALAHLHAHDFIHSDIKPENIIIHIDPSGDPRLHLVKLIDFGLSIPINFQLHPGYDVTSIHYRSYHAWSSHSARAANPSWDMFSLGCIYYELVCRRPLFDCRDHLDANLMQRLHFTLLLGAAITEPITGHRYLAYLHDSKHFSVVTANTIDSDGFISVQQDKKSLKLKHHQFPYLQFRHLDREFLNRKLQKVHQTQCKTQRKK